MTTEYLSTADGRKLAYRRSHGTGVGFVWLSGFNSDMQGSKALAVEAWARHSGAPFLAFDYSGHGQSDGDFADGCISDWRADALAAIDQLTDGPQILIGSSMGGWMALLASQAMPDRITGLVLIAPAPDFTEKLMWPSLSKQAQSEIMTKGVYMRPSEYGEPYPITRKLIEDGQRWGLLDAEIPFEGPVRILQGMQDPDVPWGHAEKLVERLLTTDLTFTLIKDGDHRLSRDQDIARLISTCEEMSALMNAR